VVSVVLRFALFIGVFADPQRTGDNGSISFWDYETGTSFQNLSDIPQPGSLEAEAGVFCSTFDVTGTRLITGCADKTIKVSLHQCYVLDLDTDASL